MRAAQRTSGTQPVSNIGVLESLQEQTGLPKPQIGVPCRAALPQMVRQRAASTSASLRPAAVNPHAAQHRARPLVVLLSLSLSHPNPPSHSANHWVAHAPELTAIVLAAGPTCACIPGLSTHPRKPHGTCEEGHPVDRARTPLARMVGERTPFYSLPGLWHVSVVFDGKF